MTDKEVCEKYNVSLSSLKSQFKRTQERIRATTGVLIEKTGRGASVVYTETFPQALTFDSEGRAESVSLVSDALRLEDWQLLVLMCVLSTPMGVFRGNGRTFLEYYRMVSSEARVKEIERAVKELEKHDWIEVIYDKTTNEGFFTIYVKRAMEKQIIIQFPQVEVCRQLMDRYNKRSFIPLLKTFIATQELQKVQPYTVAQLQAMTGLSEYTLRESNKILEDAGLIKMNKIYLDPTTCLGRVVDINAYLPEAEDIE